MPAKTCHWASVGSDWSCSHARTVCSETPHETLTGSTVEPWEMAEGVGFEPTVELPLLLISSQVPLTTQPPFRFVDSID